MREAVETNLDVIPLMIIAALAKQSVRYDLMDIEFI
jgi:hypothetical protein